MNKETLKFTKSWKRVVDNKMRSYGETDYDKKTISVNKKKSKKEGPGELLDSIIHEELHAGHPKMKEKNVRKLATKKANKIGDKTKKRLYSRYK